MNIYTIFRRYFDPLKPVPFDINEWYTIAITLLSVSIAVFIHFKKRRILWSETFFIIFWNLYLSAFGDYFLAVKPVDLYDTVDHDSFEFFDFPIHFMTYPATLYILIHVYLVTKMRKVPFILIAVAVFTLGEFVSEYYFHLFTYHGWRLLFSPPVYMVVIASNVYIFDWLHKRYQQERGIPIKR